jgi:hypothetical protein
MKNLTGAFSVLSCYGSIPLKGSLFLKYSEYGKVLAGPYPPGEHRLLGNGGMWPGEFDPPGQRGNSNHDTHG